MPKPFNAGQRFIILQPTNMQNAEVDVWVNKELVTPSEVDDPKKQLFKYKCDSKFNGAIEVKIFVKKGTVLIDQKDAYGVYPCVYNNAPSAEMVVGWAPFMQISNVLWFVSSSESPAVDNNNMIRIEEGQSLEYLHLIPNGPDWVDLYVNKESIKERFIADKTLSVSLLNECFVKANADYFMKDTDCDAEERTKNLLRNLNNV